MMDFGPSDDLRRRRIGPHLNQDAPTPEPIEPETHQPLLERIEAMRERARAGADGETAPTPADPSKPPPVTPDPPVPSIADDDGGARFRLALFTDDGVVDLDIRTDSSGQPREGVMAEMSSKIRELRRTVLANEANILGRTANEINDMDEEQLQSLVAEHRARSPRSLSKEARLITDAFEAVQAGDFVEAVACVETYADVSHNSLEFGDPSFPQRAAEYLESIAERDDMSAETALTNAHLIVVANRAARNKFDDLALDVSTSVGDVEHALSRTEHAAEVADRLAAISQRVLQWVDDDGGFAELRPASAMNDLRKLRADIQRQKEMVALEAALAAAPRAPEPDAELEPEPDPATKTTPRPEPETKLEPATDTADDKGPLPELDETSSAELNALVSDVIQNQLEPGPDALRDDPSAALPAMADETILDAVKAKQEKLRASTGPAVHIRPSFDATAGQMTVVVPMLVNPSADQVLHLVKAHRIVAGDEDLDRPPSADEIHLAAAQPAATFTGVTFNASAPSLAEAINGSGSPLAAAVNHLRDSHRTQTILIGGTEYEIPPSAPVLEFRQAMVPNFRRVAAELGDAQALSGAAQHRLIEDTSHLLVDSAREALLRVRFAGGYPTLCLREQLLQEQAMAEADPGMVHLNREIYAEYHDAVAGEVMGLAEDHSAGPANPVVIAGLYGLGRTLSTLVHRDVETGNPHHLELAAQVGECVDSFRSSIQQRETISQQQVLDLTLLAGRSIQAGMFPSLPVEAVSGAITGEFADRYPVDAPEPGDGPSAAPGGPGMPERGYGNGLSPMTRRLFGQNQHLLLEQRAQRAA